MPVSEREQVELPLRCHGVPADVVEAALFYAGGRAHAPPAPELVAA